MTAFFEGDLSNVDPIHFIALAAERKKQPKQVLISTNALPTKNEYYYRRIGAFFDAHVDFVLLLFYP